MAHVISVLLFLAALAAAPAASALPEDEQMLALLREGGQVVLMRHTVTTPGVGDPPDMRIEDCATQRNLTDEGRRDARVIGDKFRLSRVSFEHVASSPMCRCKDTARLAFGRVDEVQAPTGRGDREVREMRSFASEKRRGNSVLVSHGTTIYHAFGINTEPGEMVVVTPQGDGHYLIRGKLGFGPN